MATIKYNQNGTAYSCWSSTGRVTTPSLCFNDGGTVKYVPLFAVNNGAEGSSGNYYFKVGGLCASYNGTTYRAALSRRYASSVSNTISTTITHSGKTGTSSTTQTKTVNKSGTVNIRGELYTQTSGTFSNTVTVQYGVTFTGTPSVSVSVSNNAGYQPSYSVVSVGTSSCNIKISVHFTTSYPTVKSTDVNWSASISGNVNTTTTTYPSETKSATASGNFNYGVTYPSAPSLTVNSGGVTAANNSGNASFKASKSLSGTVAYGKSATLSQAFKVSFTGAI